jgi:hypothetical protein
MCKPVQVNFAGSGKLRADHDRMLGHDIHPVLNESEKRSTASAMRVTYKMTGKAEMKGADSASRRPCLHRGGSMAFVIPLRYHPCVRSAQRCSGRIFRMAKARTVFACALASIAFLTLAACNSDSSKSKAGEAVQAASPAPSSATTAAAPTPSELKEIQARDDYTTKLSKMLHAKMPAYKDVQIYADNWTGTKPPAHGPLSDVKARTGDNLMLVFWSPDANSAKGLSDFTKSQAARDAVDAGFAEFQFVDPANYCYAQVAPVGGIATPVCGIR